MKSKVMKKKVNYNEELSPNFSRRNEKIKYIIIHYTGTKSLLEAINIFKDKNSQVSCHWLISKRGKLYKIVDEKNVAWHAGISFWKGEKMLNNNSIGIELDNIGHGLNYKVFSNIQKERIKAFKEYKLDVANKNFPTKRFTIDVDKEEVLKFKKYIKDTK